MAISPPDLIIAATLAFTALLMTIVFLPLLLGVAVLSCVLYSLAGKIPDKRVQAAVPVIVALAAIALFTPVTQFFQTAVAGNELLWSVQFLGMLAQVPFMVIVAAGANTLFPLVRGHLGLERPWLAVAAASAVAADYLNLHNFMIGMMHGQYPAIPGDILGTPFLEILFQLVNYTSVMAISAAVFGIILSLRNANNLLAAHRMRRGILAGIVVSLLILLPAAGAGGLAVFLWQVFQRIPGRMYRIGAAFGMVLVLALAGTALSGISGAGSIADFTIITMTITALAVLVPFLALFPAGGNDRDTLLLLAAAVIADLLLSLLAVTLDLGERLTADPLSILTFTAGGMVFAGFVACAGQYLAAGQIQRVPQTGDETP